MSNLQIYKKPMLAIISEQKKLRDYEDSEKLSICTNLVANLILDLGVGKNSDTNHHLRAIKFIKDSLGVYTPQEIEEAFRLYILCKFEIEVFQQLNPIVIGKVMKQFDIYKLNKLSDYRKKESKLKIDQEMQKMKMGLEDKKKANDFTIQKSYEFFLNTRGVDLSRVYAYEVLEEYNFTNDDIKYKKEVYTDAIYLLKKEYSKKGITRDENLTFKNILKNLNNGGEKGKIISKCKELAIADIYRSFDKNKESLSRFKKEFNIS